MLKIQGFRKLVNSKFFPFFSSKLLGQSSLGGYYALIGLGSNIDDERARFDKLFRILMNDKRIFVLASSSIYINKAFGYKAQKDFFNAVILVQTPLFAKTLLKVLLYYELKFKRKRTFKNAPRTLDLDLLYFSAKSLKSAYCFVPHKEADQRLSVILPLAELQERIFRGTAYPYFYR